MLSASASETRTQSAIPNYEVFDTFPGAAMTGTYGASPFDDGSSEPRRGRPRQRAAAAAGEAAVEGAMLSASASETRTQSAIPGPR